ncbi:MAG: tyrosine-type recombinase/integrase [Blautia sp.]|uniref:tyrosine-type recombinase/integrase n=1 Tax=Blautia sp. TaxID=1955243 RepID=UPI003991BA8F
MKEKRIENILSDFCRFLMEQERCLSTAEKYMRDVRNFLNWQKNVCKKDNPLCRQQVIDWKEVLLEKKYAPVTINSMLSSVNSFLVFLGREDCRVKLLRIQKKVFREKEKELTRKEYEKLLEAARRQEKQRLQLLMECIGNTGIRVSEVKYITVEAAKAGRADISLKGKVRTILIQKKLCRRLLEYAKKRKIRTGCIFLTRTGKELSRKQIWKEMKSLCRTSGVMPEKVFPHNLRHLFAVTFYRVGRDIVKLADVLGHSSIETTRIYLLTTGDEHRRQMEKMCMLI